MTGLNLPLWVLLHSNQLFKQAPLREHVNDEYTMLKKIVSGGQTGADRAALDATIEHNFPLGGFCPKDRMAEDGRIDQKYPLTEIAGGYKQRTKKNAEDSDGTVIFNQSALEGGTKLTVSLCAKLNNPYKLIDIDLVSTQLAAEEIMAFANENNIEVLNVAGPRLSKCPAMYPFVKEAIGIVVLSLKA